MEHAINSLDRRVEIHDEKIDDIKQCLQRLTTLMERMDREEQDHEERLRALENHGNDLWDKVIMSGISAVIAGVVAFAMVQIGLG